MKQAAGSRDRRPSDKVAAQRKFFLKNLFCFFVLIFSTTVEAQHESARLKAEKEERRAIRQKKAHQKAKQQAGIGSDSDDEFEPRDNPLVSKVCKDSKLLTIKLFLLVHFP